MAPIFKAGGKSTTPVRTPQRGSQRSSPSTSSSAMPSNRSAMGSSSGKSYLSPNMGMSSNKNKKNSSTFGIVWIPTKKHNRQKVAKYYKPYEGEQRSQKERSPSMYNFMPKEHDVPKVAAAAAGSVAVGSAAKPLLNPNLPPSTGAATPLVGNDKGCADEKDGDTLDSAFLRSPPEKPKDTESDSSDNDCMADCLYYTCQILDCCIM